MARRASGHALTAHRGRSTHPIAHVLRYAGVVAHVLASCILLALTAALLARHPPAWDGAGVGSRGVVGGKGCGDADVREVFTGCPNMCHGVGTCSANRTCACREGFHGDDCGRVWCPNDCSGRGRCMNGTCVCEYLWSGPDCTVDKMTRALPRVAGIVAKSLEWDPGRDKAKSARHGNGTHPSPCPFLTASDSPSGRWRYYNEDKHRWDVLRFPNASYLTLPTTCPELRYRSCALVGNSGSLLEHALGTEIDAHEMVYRFNQAPTHGFVKHVGKRTDFESLNAHHAQVIAKEPPRDNATTVGRGRRDKKDGWLWRQPNPWYVFFEPHKLQDILGELHAKHENIKTLMYSPEFTTWSQALYNQLTQVLEDEDLGCFAGEKPMSGFYAVSFALHACDRISVYGMDPWVDDRPAAMNPDAAAQETSMARWGMMAQEKAERDRARQERAREKEIERILAIRTAAKDKQSSGGGGAQGGTRGDDAADNGGGGGIRHLLRVRALEAKGDDGKNVERRARAGGGVNKKGGSGGGVLSDDGRFVTRSKSDGHKYHYFDNDEPRPGAHSFDGVYHIYRLMATGGRLSLEPNPARGANPEPLNLPQVLTDLAPVLTKDGDNDSSRDEEKEEEEEEEEDEEAGLLGDAGEEGDAEPLNEAGIEGEEGVNAAEGAVGDNANVDAET